MKSFHDHWHSGVLQFENWHFGDKVIYSTYYFTDKFMTLYPIFTAFIPCLRQEICMLMKRNTTKILLINNIQTPAYF